MKNQGNKQERGRISDSGGHFARSWALCAAVGGALAVGALGSPAAESANRAQEKKGAGVTISAEASAKDAGLPLYPGAKPHRDKDNETPATQMGMWGSSFGFQLVVLKLESNDSPDKIAAFYKKALAKYGAVLNCTDASQTASDKTKSNESKKLDCDNDKPEPGGMLFKAGSKERQHIVGIQPNGQGSVFQLIYVEARGAEKEKQPL